MNLKTLINRLPQAAAIAGVLAVSGPSASMAQTVEVRAEFLQAPEALSWVIAAEGNRALLAIQADLLNQLDTLKPPALPEYVPDDNGPTALAAVAP